MIVQRNHKDVNLYRINRNPVTALCGEYVLVTKQGTWSIATTPMDVALDCIELEVCHATET